MKTVSIPFVFWVLLLLITCGCRKETTVSGKVYDYYTGLPAANVKVQLFKGKPGEFGFGESTIESTYTNSNGYYQLSTKSNGVEGVEADSRSIPVYPGADANYRKLYKHTRSQSF